MTDDEDDTAHVHLRIDPSTKQNWENYVEDSEHTTLSGMIRVAVQDLISSDVGSDNSELIELINEQNQLIKQNKEQNEELLRMSKINERVNEKILQEVVEDE